MSAISLVTARKARLQRLIDSGVPKRIGQTHAEGIARLVARPIQWLALISKPFVLLLSGSTAFLLRLLGVDDSRRSAVTEEEIHAVLTEGSEAGVIEKEEHRARSIARADFAALVSRTLPLLRRFERVLKPRLGLLVSPVTERVLGLALLILAVILFLPIPLGNMLPAAAICVLSLSLLEHDGLAALLGTIIGGLAVLLVWGALLALLRAGLVAIEHLGTL